MSRIAQFLSKNPSLPDIMNFVETEASRIVAEKSKQEARAEKQ